MHFTMLEIKVVFIREFLLVLHQQAWWVIIKITSDSKVVYTQHLFLCKHKKNVIISESFPTRSDQFSFYTKSAKQNL